MSKYFSVVTMSEQLDAVKDAFRQMEVELKPGDAEAILHWIVGIKTAAALALMDTMLATPTFKRSPDVINDIERLRDTLREYQTLLDGPSPCVPGVCPYMAALSEAICMVDKKRKAGDN